MISDNERQEIEAHCEEITARLKEKHLSAFCGRRFLRISDQYPGVWLEHYYDVVLFADLFPEYVSLAVEEAEMFLDGQRLDGQLPFAVADLTGRGMDFAYWQTQECVAFYALALEAYRMSPDEGFLRRLYASGKAWVKWLEDHRMTRRLGLVELFVGNDTGHDNSARLEGLKYRGSRPGKDAGEPPEADDIAPLVAVDLNAVFYGDLNALAEMATLLRLDEVSLWREKAAAVKKNLFSLCYDRNDGFFYDRDKHGDLRRYRSCTVFSLFIEQVLDKEEDREVIDRLFADHIDDREAFYTPCFYPSMALNDPAAARHGDFNCWGYYAQALTALRSILWMDAYGRGDRLSEMCEKHLRAWTAHYAVVRFGQELDPLTGIPTKSSEYYSSCMLFYLYAAKRLGIV